MNIHAKNTDLFSDFEKNRRWELTRTFMSDEGLDAIVAYGEHEDAGAAPFSLDNGMTNDRPGSTVVFPRSGEPIELVPFMNFFADHMEGLESGDAIWISAENMRAGRTSECLTGVLEELGLREGQIGVLGLDQAIPRHPEGLVPYNPWQQTLSRFPKATFTSIGHKSIPLILQLSDEELTVLRYSASIGEKMAKAMVQAIKVGVGENEVEVSTGRFGAVWFYLGGFK